MVGKKPKIALKLLRAEAKVETEEKRKPQPQSRLSRVQDHAALISKLKVKSKSSRYSLDPGTSSSTRLKRGQSSTFISSSSVGIDFKEKGTFYHLPHKEVKYTYEHKTRRRKDPYSYVDVGTDCETFFIGQKARAQYSHTEHFAYIVDLDNYEYHKVVFHSFLNEILQSAFFRYGILLLVLVNSVLIGLATLPKLKPYEGIFDIVDMVILSVFIFEIIIKWIYDFRLFWTVYWNWLDSCIIGLTMMASVIPLGEEGEHAIIAVRVVRTFRSLRCVSSMTSLSIVTHTVVKSGLDMGNILLVLIIIMLVLSVMAVILFDIEDLQPQKFLDGLDAWYVLFICVTQDGWADILNVFDKSSSNFYIIAFYLIFAVSVGAFIFANLIVAVIVANLELSVKELRLDSKIYDNPLEYHASYFSVDVEIIPVYNLLASNNFVCISQRPLKIPRLRRMSTRRIQVYVSLIVALEQNMLEAEIIALDLEKIIAVMLSVIVQIDVNTGEIAKKDKEEALEKLAKLAEMAEKSKKKKKDGKDDEDVPSQSTEQSANTAKSGKGGKRSQSKQGDKNRTSVRSSLKNRMPAPGKQSQQEGKQSDAKNLKQPTRFSARPTAAGSPRIAGTTFPKRK